MPLFYLFYLPVFFIAWAMVFPMQATAMIENIKQRLDSFIIEGLTKSDLFLLKMRLRKWGRQNGYEQGLIDDVLDKHASEIAQRLEAKNSRADLDEMFS